MDENQRKTAFVQAVEARKEEELKFLRNLRANLLGGLRALSTAPKKGA
jgi:hypothetical protein